MRTVAIDLPGHGDSRGRPRSLWEVAAVVHDLADAIGIERPIIVGHSMSSGIASIYGASYPALGVVSFGQSTEFVRSPSSCVAWNQPFADPASPRRSGPFQQSMGLDRVPEPLRSRVLAGQRVRKDIVIGYWEEMLRTDPAEMQARVDEEADRIACPCLAVFGRGLEQPEREHMMTRVPIVQIEEWPGSGHFVHLAELEHFSDRLRKFIEGCASRER